MRGTTAGRRLGYCLAAAAGLCAAVAARPEDEALADDYTKTVRPLVTRYCFKCHADGRTEADVDLKQYTGLAELRKGTRVWQKVLEMVESGQMPPKNAPQPAEQERAALRTWVRAFLKEQARATAGDPGRVVLRRLSHAEYTYTIRDLTGVPALDPLREFPLDGAAGEGFTNTGDALAMSPTLLTKYLDAAKGVAAHAVLLPDGFRFSEHATRRDHTNEILDRIRTFYGRYSDGTGTTKVNLQGLVWDARDGGRLPVERYVRATLTERAALTTGQKSVADVARERGLSARYLGLVWEALQGQEPSLLLDPLRARWRQAREADAEALTATIATWQNALWKFAPVGHVGKLNGPQAWLEPVEPLVAQQDLRWPVPPGAEGELTVYLVASDCGDGNSQDYVVWRQPRFTAPGRPTLYLRDLRDLSRALTAARARTFADTARYLQAATEATGQGKPDPAALARQHGLDPEVLPAWLDCLGILAPGPVRVEGHFTNKLQNVGNYRFVQGWGSGDTPSLVANSSDQHVRIPGNMKPRGVAVHPSPTRNVVVGWQSPVTGNVRVQAKVVHAHPECGNGITWSLEHRRGATRQRLAAGVAQGQKNPTIDPLESVAIQQGDLLSLVVGPRDGNHACDLTAVDLTLTAGDRTWDLAQDVSGNVTQANPHDDRYQNPNVWHFYTEPSTTASNTGFVIPPGSVLDRWRKAPAGEERTRLAQQVQQLLTGPVPGNKDQPDASLYRQLHALGGPLFGHLRGPRLPRGTTSAAQESGGLDPALFGRHPGNQGPVEEKSLCVRAPSVVEVRVPADLVTGYVLETSGVLHEGSRDEGSVQLQVTATRPAAVPTLQPGVPILVAEGGKARQRLARDLDRFRNLFPSAVCYTKIVPVDEVVTLTLYYREDHHLARLMLDEAQRRELDRLWDELRYVSQDALAQVDAFQQLWEYATQDSNPKLFEPLRKPIQEKAAAFRRRLLDTEPAHLDGVLRFAGQAYRRPVTQAEKDDLLTLYRRLRAQEMPHEDAVRLTLARVLVAPAFLYKLERPGPGARPTPLTDAELATRLSYFLWSSAPDAELRAAADAGKLRDPEALAAQVRRMAKDPKVRRLAVEFGCQWLHVRGFETTNEKSERHFPTFPALRGPLYEETVLFLADLFQQDRSVLNLLDADYTYLNEALAAHYGIPGVTGPEWRRVEGVRRHGRGGILGLATTLATQSGASRTSPILRGNWVSEVLLGEKLPRPPKGVPQLPDDEAKTEGLTVRQLIERHSSDPQCAVCHRRIDAYGFALEGFDAIGRRRARDLGGRAIDTKARTADGRAFEGIDGLRAYLLTQRKEAVVRQFCKKLLGYALGRAVQLSDEPLLDEMQAALDRHGYRAGVALEAVVRSRQFRTVRGTDYRTEE